MFDSHGNQLDKGIIKLFILANLVSMTVSLSKAWLWLMDLQSLLTMRDGKGVPTMLWTQKAGQFAPLCTSICQATLPAVFWLCWFQVPWHPKAERGHDDLFPRMGF